MIAFTLEGRPVTWQRTNHVSGRQVKSREQRAALRSMRSIAARAVPPGWRTDRTYAVEVVGYWPDRRYGDTDRLVNLVCDALEGVAYRTDRQVGSVVGVRRLDAERPRVEVTIAAYDEGDRVSGTIEIGG